MGTSQLKERLEFTTLENIFKSGEKPQHLHKTGLEYERIPVNTKTGKNVGYYDFNGILNFLNKFAQNEGWDYITDNTNGNVIGLKNLHDTITLEPGCQIELSIEPEKYLQDMKDKIDFYNELFKNYLTQNDIKLLNYGVAPLSTYHNINLLPKKRYHLMAKYMWGILSDVMMRETAGIQCCIDFENEQDMTEKFGLLNKISPFMTAMFANSPIRGGVETGYKSFRALSWLYTDNDRCGFANDLQKDFSYKKYLDKVLSTPMIFINRDGNTIPINGRINFKEFMQEGWCDFEAKLEDFELQANLYFPEIRLRNFLEIRNHDCVNEDLMLSILAIYKGIFYKKSAREDLRELFKEFSTKEIEDLRYNVPKSALETPIGKYKVLNIAKEILRIAEYSLIENNEYEERFLEPIKEYTFNNICPADLILRNWNRKYKQDIHKFVEDI